MKNSNQLNEFTLGQLSGILKEYPFFQLARFLYLKNLHILQKPEFEYELKKSVVYIYNRSFLHDFLFEEKIENKATKPNINSNELVKPDDEISKSTESPENPISTIQHDKPDIKETNEFEQNERRSIRKDFANSLQENISDLLNHQLEDAEIKNEKELDFNNVQIDIEKEYAKDLEKVSNKQETFVLLDDDQEDSIKKDIEEEPIDKKRISETVSYAKDLLEFDYVLKNVVKYNLNEEANASFDTENNPSKSFTEWLDSFNKSIEKPEEEKTEETASDMPLKVDETEVKNQLIDTFLTTNPAIKPEDKPFEFEDISTESIKEDDSLLTDTLARIYYNQGRYDKALEAYEKLSLKYPEKNSYFATQIEKIKNKLNDLN